MIRIKDIMYYGRYYKSLEYEFSVRWWFCKIDNNIYNVEDLLNVYGYRDFQEICLSDNYIPMFKTDVEKLEDDFLMDNVCDNRDFLKLLKENSYDTAFRKFIHNKIELTNRWLEFERKQLRNDAIVWCKNNGIPYQLD